PGAVPCGSAEASGADAGCSAVLMAAARREGLRLMLSSFHDFLQSCLPALTGRRTGRRLPGRHAPAVPAPAASAPGPARPPRLSGATDAWARPTRGTVP